MCKDRKRRVCTGYAGKRGVGRMESGREPVSTRHGALCISIKLPHDAGPPSTDHTLCNRVVINKNFKVILF